MTKETVPVPDDLFPQDIEETVPADLFGKNLSKHILMLMALPVLFKMKDVVNLLFSFGQDPSSGTEANALSAALMATIDQSVGILSACGAIIGLGVVISIFHSLTQTTTNPAYQKALEDRLEEHGLDKVAQWALDAANPKHQMIQAWVNQHQHQHQTQLSSNDTVTVKKDPLEKHLLWEEEEDPRKILSSNLITK